MTSQPLEASESLFAWPAVQVTAVQVNESEQAVHKPSSTTGQLLQVAGVSVPVEQLEVPEATKPELHVGEHVALEAKEDVQLFALPLVGAVAALQGLGVHMAAVSVPAKQLLVPDTV